MHVQGLRTRNRILPVLLAFTLSFVFLAGCGQKADGERSNMTSNSAAMSSKDTGTEAIQREDTFTIETRIIDVQNDPAFGDYGRLLFPVNSGYMSGDTLGSLRLTWYNNIDPDKTVEICNYMRDHVPSFMTFIRKKKRKRILPRRTPDCFSSVETQAPSLPS